MAKKIVLGEYEKIAKVLETHPKASAKTLNRYLKIKRNPRTFSAIRISLSKAKTVEQGFKYYVIAMRKRKIKTALNKAQKKETIVPKNIPAERGTEKLGNIASDEAKYGNSTRTPANNPTPDKTPEKPAESIPLGFFIITHPFGPNPFEAKKESKAFNYFAAVMILISIAALVILAMYVFPGMKLR